MRRRRSVLSMPADRPQFHDKAQHIPADQVMFDLEDSVAPANKNAAREVMAASLQRLPLSDKTVAVRVNPFRTEWFEADVEAALNSSRVDTLVLPKVGSADEIVEVDALLTRAGRRLGLELQIESAAGLEKVAEIAAASPLVEVLHFGPFDLAASLGTPTEGPEIPEELYLHALMRVLIAARAYGCQAIDGPFVVLHDSAGLKRSARRAARIGCDGKWAIHPGQVVTINTAFTPQHSEVQRARVILTEYARAQAEGRGVVTLNGEMLDEAILRWAEGTLARAQITNSDSAIP